MTALSELRGNAERAWGQFSSPQRPCIVVTVSTDSHARGGRETLTELRRQVQEGGLAVDIGITGSMGLSYLEPTVSVIRPDGSRVLCGPVTPDRVAELLDYAINGRVIQDIAIGV